MKRFKNILFVSDNHEKGHEAFERAAELALRNEAKLTVIGVVKVSTLNSLIGYKTVSLGDLQQRLVNERSAQIEEAIAAFREAVAINLAATRIFRATGAEAPLGLRPDTPVLAATDLVVTVTDEELDGGDTISTVAGAGGRATCRFARR